MHAVTIPHSTKLEFMLTTKFIAPGTTVRRVDKMCIGYHARGQGP